MPLSEQTWLIRITTENQRNGRGSARARRSALRGQKRMCQCLPADDAKKQPARSALVAVLLQLKKNVAPRLALCRLSLASGGHALEPRQIRRICRVRCQRRRIRSPSFHIENGSVRPFLDLCVSVAKCDSARLVVIGRRIVNPHQIGRSRRTWRWIFGHVSIVNAIGVFVHKQPDIDRSHNSEI